MDPSQRSTGRLLPPQPRRAFRLGQRAARGPDLRGQGPVPYQGSPHRLRPPGLAQDPRPGEADGGGGEAPAGGRCRHGRTHALRRALLQPDRRERALRRARQRQRAGAHPRRVVERIGRGGGGQARRFRHRLGLRRLGAHPGQLLRHPRPAPDLGSGVARRRGAVRPELRCRGLVRARCRRVREGRPRAPRGSQEDGQAKAPADRRAMPSRSSIPRSPRR